jgi:hypothetical protein
VSSGRVSPGRTSLSGALRRVSSAVFVALVALFTGSSCGGGAGSMGTTGGGQGGAGASTGSQSATTGSGACTVCGSLPCVDTMTDPKHCGQCGYVCDPRDICSQGTCVCAPPMALCGNLCRDTRCDDLNCGGCGKACTGLSHCNGGMCTCSASPGPGDCEYGVGTCDPLPTLCAGTCVDARTDPNNCGGCGMACPAMTTCTCGMCQ